MSSLVGGKTSTTSSDHRRVPLSEWIRSSFQQTLLFGTQQQQQQLLRNNNSSSAASLPANNNYDDDYLIPALRVASSLADQICKAEEAGQLLLPAPSLDWVDNIVVIISNSGHRDEDSFDMEKLLPDLKLDFQ